MIAATNATEERQANIIMGVGGVISAMAGAKIVTSFAPILQSPKAVPAKIAGKIVEFAR